MAKDSAHSKIPRLDGVTRIPVPGSIRIPTATAHHHNFQKAQFINNTAVVSSGAAVSNNNKLIRPSTITGLRPSSMASIKKPLSSERIAEAACIVGKRTATAVKKFLTKPEKSSSSSLLSSNHGGEGDNVGDSSVNDMSCINEISSVKLIKDETIILDKGMKDTANQKLMIVNTTFIGQNESQKLQQQQQQTLPQKDCDNKHQQQQQQQKQQCQQQINVTRTLTKSDTFIRDQNDDDKNDTHNCSNERLSDISFPSCCFDITSELQKQHKNDYDNDDEFENCEHEGHSHKINIIDDDDDLNATCILAPDKGEPKMLNSTMTDYLLDITAAKLSPGQQLMNLTKDLNETVKYDQNNTKLLYMSHTGLDSPLLENNQQFLTTNQIQNDDEPMDVDELSKPDENTFEIPSNLTQVLSSRVIQELKQNKPRYSFGLDLTECLLDCSIELCDNSLASSTAQASSLSLKKQNSFEMDDSLGILTPDQMKENFFDSTTTTTNLDLPINLHQTGSKLDLHQIRIDKTPSPEDLPLDPVGVKTDITDIIMTAQPAIPPVQHLIAYQEISQTDTDSKTDQMTKSSASKVSNSFITSVTSITSLDTGYQGDGEMSRPASRGPIDHSPSNGPRKPQLGRQPSFNHHNPPNIPIRRQDPMTDSDFFTESDADDIFHRGDRRAQVIDGQLYGPMLQPANVFITEQPQMGDSCMESSGIFTDVENRCDDELSRSRREADIDMSPDGSTDTVKSNNTEYNNNDNLQKQQQKRQLSQSCISPIDQNNPNILTDSQTSSTIQSSLSSELIGGSACSIGADCIEQQQSKNQQLQFKRNATISGGDVTINSTSLKSSVTNSSSTGALNVNLICGITQNNDSNDKKISNVQKNQQQQQQQLDTTTTSVTTTTIGANTSTTIQKYSTPHSTQSTSSSPSVKKVSPSRKQHSHGIVGGKHENKSNINNSLTKTDNGSVVVSKSKNVNGSAKKSNQNQHVTDTGGDIVNGGNNDNINISGSGGNNTSDMLEKKSVSKNISSTNTTANQENKRPGSIATTILVSHHNTNPTQISPNGRKIVGNKWDAVMNKIAENKSVYKKNYNDVKSKVATGMLKRSKPGSDLIKSPSGVQSQTDSNCGSLNSVSGLSSPKTPSGKRILQGATKRGRSYSKDSQQSSQSDLSLSGGSPKLHTKLSSSTRSAKKRDVRTLSISPTDLGPPPKSQTNTASRTKQSQQVLSQKRFSPNVQQTSITPNNKASPPSAKKATIRRPQAQQQSHTKTPLKDHNRLIIQNQSHHHQQQQHNQQQIQQLNASPKTTSGVGIKGILPSATTTLSGTQIQVTGVGLKVNSKTSLPHTPSSPILDENNLNNITPASILQSVQSHKKQHHILLQQQQQKEKDKTLCREAALELHLAHANKSVEALGVLLQYLAHDLDAFACPSTKKDYANAQKNLIETRLLLEEAKSSCHELQDQLQDKETYYTARESELQALHRCELKKVETSLIELEVNAKERIQTLENELAVKNEEHEKQLKEYIKQSEQKFTEYETQIHVAKEKEQELLKQISVLSTKENELKDKIQTTENNFAERLRAASQRERELTEKVNTLNKQLEELRQRAENRERDFEDKLNLLHDEISILRVSRNSFDQVSSSPKNNGLSTSLDGGCRSSTNKVQMLQNEVESLRSVLELKQSEVSDLRIKNQEMQRAVEGIPAMQMKISALESRIEDLQIQLETKAEEEKDLIQKNKHLQDSLTHEVNHRRNISLHNEELQWRLKQNSERFALKLSELSKSLSKSNVSSQHELDLSRNFNQLNSPRIKDSDRSVDRISKGCFDMDDLSPPASPIIKGIVEKSDSVSWVFEMDDETPEIVGSRMILRAGSFRSSFNEKLAAASGNGTKRQYLDSSNKISMNPLTQSASATSVLRQHSSESMTESSPSHPVSSRIRSKSVTIKSPEQKKIARQNSVGNGGNVSNGGKSSQQSEPILSSSWKDPIYTSSPYTRRPSNTRSPLKEPLTPHHHSLGATMSTSTPFSSLSTKRERTDSFNTDNENGLFNQKHEPNLITCDTSALTSASEPIEMCSLPTHQSVQDLKNLKKCQPEIQESAGEAMVSGTNSEDEGCSASSDEAVSSASTASTVSSSSTSTSSLETDKHQHNMIDCMLIGKINCNNSLSGTPMEVSWSDDGDHFPSESIV